MIPVKPGLHARHSIKPCTSDTPLPYPPAFRARRAAPRVDPALTPPDAPLQASLPLGFTGHVVCIGASAGGLDALERFFDACPADSSAAYVVVQHLSPDHKSMMASLLARHTPMPVTVVENDMAIRADHVYLIPPGAIMHASPGQLHLQPKNPRGLTLPIDIFLASAAEAFGRRAVGVILSGTGSDGSRGAVAVNAAGGFLVAQKPDTAKFDGMPRSLIGTGLADAVLAPQDIPARLVQLFGATPATGLAADAPAAPLDQDQALDRIFHLLRALGGIAFQDYKPATVMRRIERRMQVRHAHGLASYVALLDADPDEVLTLRRELLIPVTSFFRDPDTFEALATTVVRRIVAESGTSDTVRVWCAGVSTGEEPYSVAMLFLEEFERARRWPALKVFATDVDPGSLDTAGNGLYPESAAAEIAPGRLERFFSRQDDRIMVKTELRQCMVFARHNLLEDPPFTRMDLVVCRNVLIDFRSEAQQRALHTLKYAVNPGGCLLLGSSESLGADAGGFRALDARNKLFQRTGYVGPLATERLASANGKLARAQRVPPVRQPARPREATRVDAGMSALLERYAPPAILLNAAHQALHLYGAVQPYLRMKAGQASLELSRILPDTLAPVASALVYKAMRDMAGISTDAVRATLADGAQRALRLTALPVPGNDDGPLTLLCIEEAGVPASVADAEHANLDAETMEHVKLLERELAATRASLQVSIEELETANEELQSVNKELNTVNAEFQEKMLILNRLNADLDSMGKASGVATVFVDSKLRLTRFNPDATRIFKLRDGDLGRRLDDFAHNLDYPALIADLEHTLRTNQALEREVASLDGATTYLMRLLTYTVPSSGEAGAVATFDDIGPLRHAERLQAVLDALPEHIAVLAEDGTILLVNEAWRAFARDNGDPGLARSGPGTNYLGASVPAPPKGDAAGDAAMEGVRRVLDGSATNFSIEYPCHSPEAQRWFLMHAAVLGGQTAYRAVVSHVDITAWHGGGR